MLQSVPQRRYPKLRREWRPLDRRKIVMPLSVEMDLPAELFTESVEAAVVKRPLAQIHKRDVVVDLFRLRLESIAELSTRQVDHGAHRKGEARCIAPVGLQSVAPEERYHHVHWLAEKLVCGGEEKVRGRKSRRYVIQRTN